MTAARVLSGRPMRQESQGMRATPIVDALTVNELLTIGADRWPEKMWCRTSEGTMTRPEARESGARCAGGITAHGVEPGDHVVIVLPNGLDFVRAWFGVAMSGAISIAVNPRAVTELSGIVDRLSPKMLILDPSLGVPSLRPETSFVSELMEHAPVAPATVQPPSAVTYIQTSGSTGKPKFVIETHRMYAMGAVAFPWWLGLGEADVMLSALPLSHMNAQLYSMLGSYASGSELVLLPRFSASTFWDDVVRYGATQFNSIGAMLEILLRQEPSQVEQHHRVRLCYSAPAPAPARHRAIEERFGFRLVVGYAQSESPFGLVAGPDTPLGSMGQPRQHPTLGSINQVRTVDDSGALVPPGTVGEIVLRNPATTPGYYGQPEETNRILRDGWLHTGDLASADAEGNYFFAGRTKEIIRRRGENITPAEVENVLNTHPMVSVSAVIGVPSELSEEDVKAFVLARDGCSPSARDLRSWCEERLPTYKCPRYIEFVESLPLTDSQKIAKSALRRERTAHEVDLEVGPQREGGHA